MVKAALRRIMPTISRAGGHATKKWQLFLARGMLKDIVT
jgi:hypothetical protein